MKEKGFLKEWKGIAEVMQKSNVPVFQEFVYAVCGFVPQRYFRHANSILMIGSDVKIIDKKNKIGEYKERLKISNPQEKMFEVVMSLVPKDNVKQILNTYKLNIDAEKNVGVLELGMAENKSRYQFEYKDGVFGKPRQMGDKKTKLTK